jgi:hypothetical protein
MLPTIKDATDRLRFPNPHRAGHNLPRVSSLVYLSSVVTLFLITPLRITPLRCLRTPVPDRNIGVLPVRIKYANYRILMIG